MPAAEDALSWRASVGCSWHMHHSSILSYTRATPPVEVLGLSQTRNQPIDPRHQMKRRTWTRTAS